MRSLESRIITLFILFVLGVQVVGFISLQRAQESKSRSAMETELDNSKQAIQRLLDQRTTTLTEAVTKLVNDGTFANSLLSGQDADRNKVESILARQATRLNASMAWMTGQDGRIQGASSRLISAKLKQMSAALLLNSDQQDFASTIVTDNHIPLQLIAALLKTPATEAWVVMAFPLEKKFVLEMEKVTSLPVTILVRNEKNWQVVSSSLKEAEANLLAKNVPEVMTSNAKKLMLNDAEYSVQMIALVQEPPTRIRQAGEEAVIVLQGSISDMLAPYSKVQIGLILLTMACLGVAVYGNLIYIKRIRQPLQRLGEVARRLGGGEYDIPIEVSGDEGIRDLAQAFKNMRDGISYRENEIKRLAYWDILTDLPNRAKFTGLLKQVIEASNPLDQACFVLLLDLDRFKHVNDLMGHSLGDLFLQKVANRLREALPGSQLARLGGDEFALLLSNSSLAAAQESALIILLLLEHPMMLGDQTVDLGAGIGIAGYPEHGENAEVVLSHAEVAMYAAKRKAGNNYVVYCPEIDHSSQISLSLLSELRSAIHENQLRLYVQPKFNLAEREVVGVEALVRWMHPTRGFLMPDKFIPFAEQSGIIRMITKWVLDKSAELYAELTKQGIEMKISVNISTHDLMDQDLLVKFADILRRYRIKTGSFCMEITESAIMTDPHRAQQTLERLGSMGVELSIDDFGTGYSSLSYLKRLAVNELKIDKSFVMQMEHDADDRKIVKSTIELGHNMGLRVVAEGVEDAAVMTLLTQMGCDQVQGNYINPPIPADQFVDWLARRETLLFSENG